MNTKTSSTATSKLEVKATDITAANCINLLHDKVEPIIATDCKALEISVPEINVIRVSNDSCNDFDISHNINKTSELTITIKATDSFFFKLLREVSINLLIALSKEIMRIKLELTAIANGYNSLEKYFMEELWRNPDWIRVECNAFALFKLIFSDMDIVTSLRYIFDNVCTCYEEVNDTIAKAFDFAKKYYSYYIVMSPKK